MTRERKKPDSEDDALLADMSTAELDETLDSLATDGSVDKGEPEPLMSSVEWNDFVLKQFSEDELDKGGAPLVHGLRRVARKLLGPILYSGPLVGGPHQAPSLLSGMEKLGFLHPAMISYAVTFLVTRTEDHNLPAYEATFADVADAYFGNCEADYARHSSAMASTRAESRCLRKALQIRGVSAEEKTVVTAADAMLDGMINSTQMNFLNILCARNDINVMKYVNMGKDKYENISKIPAGKAAVMVEYLDGLQRGGDVPPAIKGYDSNWSKT